MNSNHTILKFDQYPKAIAWLSLNPGIAVRGESEHLGVVATHILFSDLIPENQRLMLLEHFPSAQKLDQCLGLDDEKRHDTYLVHQTRKAIVTQFQRLGWTVKRSPCCMEMVAEEECFETIQEMRIRAARPLSSLSAEELGDLYRSING